VIPSSGLRSRSVFVDTSAFFAGLNPRDADHDGAVATFTALATDGRPLTTSNLIVAEAHALILRRMGRDVAAAWLDRTEDLNIVFETEEDSEAGRDIIARYSDKEFSYTDAVSFAIMERLGISVAFAFDDDFRQCGLDVIP
jgi:predicted nucleic acid-binding protein